jgi:hypothetical protein
MEALVILKPQDVLVLLKLVAIGDASWSYSRLAGALWMSPSEVHAGVKRAVRARLAALHRERVVPNRRNLEEFLVHGLPYVFVPEQGEVTRGIPTGYAGPPLRPHFQDTGDLPPVWPVPDGEVRGMAFTPLYKSVPQAAREDEDLYSLLTLVDAVRGGRTREREMAAREIGKRLQHAADA